MNKRKAKKMRKKQDMFIDWFASSYRQMKENARAYHEFVIMDRRRCKEEECLHSDWDFFDDDF